MQSERGSSRSTLFQGLLYCINVGPHAVITLQWVSLFQGSPQCGDPLYIIVNININMPGNDTACTITRGYSDSTYKSNWNVISIVKIAR